MAVVTRPALSGLIRAYTTPTSPPNLYYMLCDDDTTKPWEVFDTTPGTTHPGTFQDIRAAGLEIATGGGYFQDGIYSMGTGVVNFDAALQILEIGFGAGPTWIDGTYLFSCTFQHIVIGASWDTGPWDYDITTIGVIDTGTATALAAAPLSITFVESTTFPGTYPVASWTA